MPRSTTSGPGDLVVAGGYLFATAVDRVVRLSTALDGSGWKTYGGFGTGVGQFKGASGIATASGFLYVADAYNDRVVRLSTALNGSGWKTYGTSGTGTGQFNGPAGIAVSAGYAYVADHYNDRVVRLSTKLDGSGWKAYGSPVRVPASSRGPSAIAVLGSFLFVADSCNARIVKLKAPSLAGSQRQDRGGAATRSSTSRSASRCGTDTSISATPAGGPAMQPSGREVDHRRMIGCPAIAPVDPPDRGDPSALSRSRG